MKLSIFLTLLVVFVTVFSLITPGTTLTPAQAQVGEAGATVPRILFGGRIQEVDICTCPIRAFLWLKIGPPRPSQIVLTWSTLQYLHYAYFVGNWTLGDAAPVLEACQDLAPKRGGTFCSPVNFGFPAIHIGTSLIPGYGAIDTSQAP